MEDIKTMISKAKMVCVINAPLMAYQLFNCQIELTERVKYGAASNHGMTPTIHINPTTFASLTKKQRPFLLLHEDLHIFLHHLGRQSDMGYDPELWNIATDFYINPVCLGYYRDSSGNIQRNKNMAANFEFIEGGLLNLEYVGMSSDEIYHALIEKHGSIEEAKAAYGEPGEGDDQNGAAYDEVSEEAVGGESKANIDRITASAITSVERTKSFDIGDGYSDSLIGTFRELFEVKKDWKTILSESIKSNIPMRTTYNRLSRRSYDGICFPSYIGDKISLGIGIDTSGSMGAEQIKETLSEIYGILEQFDSWDVTILTCDTKPHLIGRYRSEEGDTFDTIEFERMIGGGGTELSPMLQHIQDQNETDMEPHDTFIFMTDGYIPTLPIENVDNGTLRKIFLITSNGNTKLEVRDSEVLTLD